MAKPSVQQALPPMLLPKREQDASLLPNQEQQPEVPVHEADAMAAELFDAALKAARIESGEVAYLFGVSESLVRKMRSATSRERVSFAQLLRLPPVFHLCLHRQMNKRFGFGRQALRDVLDALGTLAVLEVER